MSGTAISDGNGNFHFDFTLPNGVHKYFSGKFSSAIPAWSGSGFVLTPTDGSGTSGKYDIKSGSVVGPATINIQLLNSDTGTTITFTVGNVWPNLDKGYTVQGDGSWASSLSSDE